MKAEEFYEEYNKIYHTDDGTTNKYDITADKSGMITFAERFASHDAQERYEKAYEFLKEHAQKHEWFAAVDALKIASGLKTT